MTQRQSLAIVSTSMLLIAWCERQELLQTVRDEAIRRGLLESVREELLRRGLMNAENPEAEGAVLAEVEVPVIER